jgi:hypothetical protein
VKDPDRPLVGSLWTIDTFIQGDAVSSGTTTKPLPRVLFRADGSVLLRRHCSRDSQSN